MTIPPTPLQVRLIRSLMVDPLQHPRGQGYLSAASGLVRIDKRLYVVADDELHLGVFDDDTDATPSEDGQGTLMRLLDGHLPEDKSERKKAKPDLECLTLLPPLPGCPSGAMLALGSGSRPNRETGVLVALDVHGLPNGRMTVVDLASLYAPLRKRFVDLNIEGALVVDDELLVLQRGNQGLAVNACIRYDWSSVAPWLAGCQVQPPAAKSVQLLALGSVGGVPLGLTDGAALQGGAWAFSAVAENTDNSYQDGACVGSAIGTVGPDGKVQQLHTLQAAPKVEGISVLADGDAWVCTLVTDPDDPGLASQLLEVRFIK